MLSLNESIHLHAASRPGELAVRDDARSLSFAELDSEIGAIASFLTQRRTGGRLGVQVGNSVEHVVTLIAAERAGVTVVPFDPRWDAEAVESFIAQTGVRVMAADDSAAGAGPVVFNEVGSDQSFDYADSIAAGSSSTVAPRHPADSEILTLAPSGGTSRVRKAYRVSASATIARFLLQAAEFGLSRGGRYVAATPLFHGAARSLSLGHLYFGSSVIVHRRFDPSLFVRDAAEATAAFAVPTMLKRILESGARDLQPSFSVISGGSPIPRALAVEVVAHLTPNLFDYYASVETGGISVLHPGDLHEVGRSVGRPAFGVEVIIAGPEAEALGPGEEGRIAVRSSGMCSGAEGIELEVLAGGFVVTGDVGHLRADGSLVVVGRHDDVIISGGVNIDPVSVEQVLEEHESVVSAGVVGLPDAEWGERVVAAVTMSSGDDTRALEAWVTARLHGPSRPKDLVALPELPVTSIGKLDRRRLRELLLARSEGEPAPSSL